MLSTEANISENADARSDLTNISLLAQNSSTFNTAKVELIHPFPLIIKDSQLEATAKQFAYKTLHQITIIRSRSEFYSSIHVLHYGHFT